MVIYTSMSGSHHAYMPTYNRPYRTFFLYRGVHHFSNSYRGVHHSLICYRGVHHFSYFLKGSTLFLLFPIGAYIISVISYRGLQYF